MQGYHQEPHSAQRVRPSGDLHTGVVSFMNGVYAWMAAGIGVTAAVGWFVTMDQGTFELVTFSPLRWVLIIGILAMAWFLPSRMARMDKGIALALFFVFAGMMGATSAWILKFYTSASIVGVFAATAGMFAVLAVFGFVTKKDLTGVGQFLLMALIGAVIASLVNVIFLHSGTMSMIVSIIVAVAAAGLTAYHTQAIKQLYMMHGGGSNLAIVGALLLYVDFINLFMSLLRLFGSSRD
jgi:FtsH-binding integral membrane protein